MLNTPGQSTSNAMQTAMDAAAIRIHEGRVNGGHNNGGGGGGGALNLGRLQGNAALLANVHRHHHMLSRNAAPSNSLPGPSAVPRPLPTPGLMDSVAKMLIISLSKHLTEGNSREFLQGFIEEQADDDLTSQCEAELAREVNDCLNVPPGLSSVDDNMQSGSSFLDAIAYTAVANILENGATTVPGTPLHTLGPNETVPGSSIAEIIPPHPSVHVANTSDLNLPDVITDLYLPQPLFDGIRKQILEHQRERNDAALKAAQKGVESARGKPRGCLAAAFQSTVGNVNADQALREAQAADMKFGGGSQYQAALTVTK